MILSMFYMVMAMAMTVHAMNTDVSVYDSLYLPKVLHMARYSNCSFLFKPVFIFSLLQEGEKKRVIEVNHRYNKPLWFLPSCTDQYPHATLWRYGAVFILATVLQVQVHPHVNYFNCSNKSGSKFKFDC
jgi:hypothetical protein